MKNQPILKIILICYFTANLLVRWMIISSVNQLLTFAVGVVLCVLFFCIVAFPRYLKYFLCVFAFTFPLYGVPSSLYTRTHVFEFLLCAQSLALLVVSIRWNLILVRSKLINKLLFLYLLYSALSIFLFSHYGYEFLWQPKLFFEGWMHMLYANNWTALYSIAGVNRLGIFIFSALLIACQENAAKVFKAIFVSMLIAGIIAAIVGIMQQYNLLYLWFSESHHQGRLQSVFSHPNVFAMYMTITIPFILYGFLRGSLSRKLMFLLFFVIIICEIAIVFSGCRASWLVYPLTLFFCGLCVYWQKNGDLN